jgi:single-strand DNA-binding protein
MSINNVTLVGRLTRDLELNPKSKTPVAEGTIALDGIKKDSEASYITIVLFGDMAANTQKFCGKKGSMLGVVGHLQSSTYKDKHDSTHYVTKVIVGRVQWLESKNSNTTQAPAAEYESEMTPVDDGEIPF